MTIHLLCRRMVGILVVCFVLFCDISWVWASEPLGNLSSGGGARLDETGGFIHLAPGVVHTNNGCSEFSVSILATLTDARVFGLRFLFDEANLELISVTPGDDSRLHLLPHQLADDTLRIDGFFHPNFSFGTVTIATLTARAISTADVTTEIGFVSGQGFSGNADNPDPIIMTGDTATVIVDGTPPLPPDSVVIVPLPYPAHDDSVRLQWRRVTEDIYGNAVINPLYHVYMHDVLNNTDFMVASVPDTFVYDEFIHITFPCTTVVNVGVYEVRACKTQP